MFALCIRVPYSMTVKYSNSRPYSTEVPQFCAISGATVLISFARVRMTANNEVGCDFVHAIHVSHNPVTRHH